MAGLGDRRGASDRAHSGRLHDRLRRSPHRPVAAEQQHMLASLGYSSVGELIAAALPEATPPAQLSLPDPLTETEALAKLRRMAGRNQVLTSMIGMGYHDSITPPVIHRTLLEIPACTRRTPLPARDLPGPPRGAAELPDHDRRSDRAAVGERLAARRGHRRRGSDDACARSSKTGDVFLADADCHPQTLAVVQTRAAPLGIEIVVARRPRSHSSQSDHVRRRWCQYPRPFGERR